MSTYEDLIDHRLAAMEAILAAGHIPAAMEQFSAGDDTAWERITRWIDASDAFILIVGGRYGSIEPTSGKSYVQLEYEYAIEKKKPYFALVISDVHLENWVKQEGFKVDERTHRELYLEFKKQVKQKLCAPWEDKKDIKQAIFHKLPEWAERADLVGWIRADEAAKPEVTNEIARLSRENRELRANAPDLATYGGLSYDDLCELLTQTDVTIQPGPFKNVLGILEIPSVDNLLDLFRTVADAIVKGQRFGFALGPGADGGAERTCGLRPPTRDSRANDCIALRNRAGIPQPPSASGAASQFVVNPITR